MANQHSAFKLIPQAMARAYLSATQENLPDTSWTKILLDAESYDPGSCFDTANNRFVAPITGYYIVTGAVYFLNAIANKRYVVGIFKDGGEYAIAAINSSTPTEVSGVISDVVYLAKNSYVELWAIAVAGAPTVDVGSNSRSTFMAVHLLSAV